jgi:hypothetical protein
MKITKSKLKQIIKEELSKVLGENVPNPEFRAKVAKGRGRALHIDGIKKKLYGVHPDGTPGTRRNWAETKDGKPDGPKTLYWLDANAPQWDRDMDDEDIQARGKYQEQLEWNISTLEGQLAAFRGAEGGSVDLPRGEQVD